MEQRAAPVCVGIDPVADRLPSRLRPQRPDPASNVRAIRDFCLGVLDAVAPHVPCVKVQAACFERYHAEGVEAMRTIIAEARTRGLQVILDAKRGDIGVTAAHYAASVFGDEADSVGPNRADWVTINSYLGADGIEPFLRGGCGAFALVRTSNPGGDVLQAARLVGGLTVAEAVAAMVAGVGTAHLGALGFSSLGAVVGATKADEASRLRELMPQQVILVPGYGAQGGTVRDVVPCFHRGGKGAIVTASRSVLYAFEPDVDAWKQAVAAAAERLADDVGRAVGLR
jgi:orotidine-5'-phosphate decarboxylase